MRDFRDAKTMAASLRQGTRSNTIGLIIPSRLMEAANSCSSAGGRRGNNSAAGCTLTKRRQPPAKAGGGLLSAAAFGGTDDVATVALLVFADNAPGSQFAPDLYGSFSVKWFFGLLPVPCSERKGRSSSRRLRSGSRSARKVSRDRNASAA